MKFSNLTFALMFLTSLSLYSCSKDGKKASTSNGTTATDSVVSMNDNKVLPVNQKLTNVAKFIAGMPVDDAELKPLTNSEVWKKYAAEAEPAWKNFDKRAEKYRAFSKTEIVAPYDTVKTLFYPFSGPDYLFANALFPNVHKMILIGLETPGKIPQFSGNSVSKLKQQINTYKSSITDVMQLSFFRTNDMKNDSTSSFVGTTSVIMIFLVRSGKEIDDVNLLKINENGDLVKTDKNANAVEVKYHNKNENFERTIVYISTNLADDALKKNKGMMNFLNNKVDDNCDTFLKSATYLMHKTYFSTIRNICLKKSTMILQDESGISYKFFKDGKWDIQLYGTYTKPISLFSMYFQPDYLEAFKTSNPKPLNFRIGYDAKSNLLLAKKKK